MMRLFQGVFFVFAAYVIGASAARAQTPPACGCAFAKDRPVRNVRVIFAGRGQPVAAKPEMVIQTGDLIMVTRPVVGTLVCDNVRTPVTLTNTPRNRPVPCRSLPPEGVLIGRNGRKIEGTTMGNTFGADFPVALAPRSTKLLNGRPLLRWTSVPGVTSYKVTVRGEEGSWSTSVAAGTGSQTQEILYPQPCASGQTKDCAPALKAGESYKLIVEANGRSSEEEDLPNLGFTLLTAAEVQRVQGASAQLRQLPLGKQLKTKMLASLYANNGLNADAIATLEGDQSALKNPEAVRLLGSLYLTIGLTRNAEALYLSLLQPGLAEQDTLSGQAVTQQTLGEIYERLGNRSEAVKYYIRAVLIFQSLQDADSANSLRSRLTDLQR